MEQIEEGTLLWEPDENWKQQSNLYHYMKWLKKYKNLNFQDYHSLWKWSVDELEVFWSSLWEYFEIQSDQPYQTVLTSHNKIGRASCRERVELSVGSIRIEKEIR